MSVYILTSTLVFVCFLPWNLYKTVYVMLVQCQVVMVQVFLHVTSIVSLGLSVTLDTLLLAKTC